MSNEKYNPQFFSANSMQQAKDIVLMYHEMSADERWEPETDWTRDLLLSMRSLDENSVVLDFGTGIGRLAKMLIDTFGCKVVGVDISPDMLKYAKEYVNSDRYETMTSDEFTERLYNHHFTHAIAVWVLQHSPVSQFDIAKIQQSLKEDGKFFVIDMRWKCIPEKGDHIHATNFYNDGVDNRAELEKFFHPLAIGTIPPSITTQSIVDISWWGFLQKNREAA